MLLQTRGFEDGCLSVVVSLSATRYGLEESFKSLGRCVRSWIHVLCQKPFLGIVTRVLLCQMEGCDDATYAAS